MAAMMRPTRAFASLVRSSTSRLPLLLPSTPLVFARRLLCSAPATAQRTAQIAPPRLAVHVPDLRRRSPHGSAHVRRRLGGVRAAQVNESGSIDSNMISSMEKKIKEQLSADMVTVQDAYGDGRHVSIDVTSSAFEGQSAVNRQRMVYKAIWEELQSTVHAVDQMTTRTPAEAAENQ